MRYRLTQALLPLEDGESIPESECLVEILTREELSKRKSGFSPLPSFSQ